MTREFPMTNLLFVSLVEEFVFRSRNFQMSPILSEHRISYCLIEIF